MATFDLRALQHWLRSFDVHLDDSQLDQAQAYLGTLLLWNRKMNLVSQIRPEEILIKHFADSFVAASLIADRERVVDLGSGGGFPAIPMAIAKSEASFTLVESNQKKASFLAEAIVRCRLERAHVVNQRIAQFGEQLRTEERFQTLTARALSTIADLAANAADILAEGGRLLALKGPNFREELDLLTDRRFNLARVLDYELPDKSTRHVLELRFT